jgi:hypothetical protein
MPFALHINLLSRNTTNEFPVKLQTSQVISSSSSLGAAASPTTMREAHEATTTTTATPTERAGADTHHSRTLTSHVPRGKTIKLL